MLKKHGKAGGIIIAACLFIVYLWAIFKPGLWHGDAFLHHNDVYRALIFI